MMHKTQNSHYKRNLLLATLTLGIFVCIESILSQTFYNLTYGPGFEGFLNYSNLYVDGYMVIAFIAFIWTTIMFGLTKAGWDSPICAAFAFFVTLITSIIFALFTTVSSYVIFISAIGMAGSIAWAFAKGKQ